MSERGLIIKPNSLLPVSKKLFVQKFEPLPDQRFTVLRNFLARPKR
jgi:hypothetical protein